MDLSALNLDSLLQWQGVWKTGTIEQPRLLYDYELVYFSSGAAIVGVGDRLLNCTAGSLVIIPPRMIQDTQITADAQRWSLHFDWYGQCLAQRQFAFHPFIDASESEQFREELMAAPPPPELGVSFPLFVQVPAVQMEDFLKEIQAFFATANNASAPGLFARRAALWQIIGFVLKLGGKFTRKPIISAAFLKAKEYIDNNYTVQGLQLWQVAKAVQITPNHLLKLFRKEIGISTQDYLQMRRKERVERLLVNTTLSISEIAVLSGFTDANYLTRVFKKEYGCTPTEYRSRIFGEAELAAATPKLPRND